MTWIIIGVALMTLGICWIFDWLVYKSFWERIDRLDFQLTDLQVDLALIQTQLADISLKLKEISKESNKDAAAIKRRQTWSKKREKKDLKVKTKKYNKYGRRP